MHSASADRVDNDSPDQEGSPQHWQCGSKRKWSSQSPPRTPSVPRPSTLSRTSPEGVDAGFGPDLATSSEARCEIPTAEQQRFVDGVGDVGVLTTSAANVISLTDAANVRRTAREDARSQAFRDYRARGQPLLSYLSAAHAAPRASAPVPAQATGVAQPIARAPMAAAAPVRIAPTMMTDVAVSESLLNVVPDDTELLQGAVPVSAERQAVTQTSMQTQLSQLEQTPRLPAVRRASSNPTLLRLQAAASTRRGAPDRSNTTTRNTAERSNLSYRTVDIDGRELLFELLAQIIGGGRVQGLDQQGIDAHTSTMRLNVDEGTCCSSAAVVRECHARDTQTKCMVCLEDFESGQQLRVLPCLHRYHRDCVDKWLALNRLCPVCKHDVTQNDRTASVQLSPGTDSSIAS